MEEFTGGGTPADGESIGSGASDDKSVNGERVRHRETNGDLTEEPRPNKGSRRTTSLLNLFIPLSQGMSINRVQVSAAQRKGEFIHLS